MFTRSPWRHQAAIRDKKRTGLGVSAQGEATFMPVGSAALNLPAYQLSMANNETSSDLLRTQVFSKIDFR
jgi:hypothetical protein